MSRSALDGCRRLREAVRLWGQFCLNKYDAVVLEGLVQLEEDAREGEYDGVTPTVLADAIQLSPDAAKVSLNELRAMRVAHAILPPPVEKEKGARVRREGKRTRDEKIEDGEESDDEEDQASEQDEVELASGSKPPEADAEAREIRFAIDYRFGLVVSCQYFRRIFGRICCVTVPLDVSSHLTTHPRAPGVQTVGIRCRACNIWVTAERVSNGCPTCKGDVIIAVLRDCARLKFDPNSKEHSTVDPSDLPRKLLDDTALLCQGLIWAACFVEPLVLLQDPSLPLTSATEAVTRNDFDVSLQQGGSSLALRYRTVPHIPVQLESLRRKEEEAARAFEARERRKALAPPWLQTQPGNSLQLQGAGEATPPARVSRPLPAVVPLLVAGPQRDSALVCSHLLPAAREDPRWERIL